MTYDTPAPALLEDKTITGRSVECMGRFADAMGERFTEGVRLLDYGCGSGRFGAYLATRVQDFAYWGFDLQEQVARWRLAQTPLHADRRYLGFYWLSQLEDTRALHEASDVLLLSVLTHLSHGALLAILTRLLPVLDRGGVVHASLYLGQRVALEEPKNYGEDGLPVYWRRVIYTSKTVGEVCKALGIKWSKTGSWTKKWEQSILSFRRPE